MNYIFSKGANSVYPYTIWMLRRDNPNVGFNSEPTPQDLAPFNVYPVENVAQPEIDERTQILSEGHPVRRDDGQWFQAWEVRAATPDEIAAWDAAHPPAPSWSKFGIKLVTNEAFSNFYDALPSALSNGLSIGLSEASKGNYSLFAGLWKEVLSTGLVDENLLSEISALAEECNLPEALVDGFRPIQRIE